MKPATLARFDSGPWLATASARPGTSSSDGNRRAWMPRVGWENHTTSSVIPMKRSAPFSWVRLRITPSAPSTPTVDHRVVSVSSPELPYTSNVCSSIEYARSIATRSSLRYSHANKTPATRNSPPIAHGKIFFQSASLPPPSALPLRLPLPTA